MQCGIVAWILGQKKDDWGKKKNKKKNLVGVDK